MGECVRWWAWSVAQRGHRVYGAVGRAPGAGGLSCNCGQGAAGRQRRSRQQVSGGVAQQDTARSIAAPCNASPPPALPCPTLQDKLANCAADCAQEYEKKIPKLQQDIAERLKTIQ